ncbi:MAG: hypothetical protein HYV97_06695 [Bdellovibrio sp.]|nr:hypothetical protein [Bdellovibrio sp.]
MKWLKLLFLIFGIALGQIQANEVLEEFRRLYAPDIQEYGVVMQSMERMEGELVLANETYAHEQCDSIHFRDTSECKKAKADVQRRSALIAAKRRRLAKLKIKLKDYLDYTQGILQNSKNRLEANGVSSSQISGTLTCLQTLGGLAWVPEINKLYTQGMAILGRYNRQLYLDHLRSLPGFSRDECARQDQVECWHQEGGIYYYVARGHIQISEGCLTRQAAGGRLDWSTFPSNPLDYLEAARQVAQTVAPRKGCYRGINREKAESLALYFETKHPRIQCTPESRSERETSDGGERCAYTHSGSLDLYLTAPNLCGGLARTLFHESMHAEGSIDNLQTHHHNNSACRSYDAIYHCSYLCFPENPRPHFFHRSGCESCVSEERVDTLCRGLPDRFDLSFQTCGWGH